MKIAVAYGAGTNSTAMLVGLKELGIRPDFITFADTGGERPETYDHLGFMCEWVRSAGFPEIDIVKKVDKNGDIMTLEENCLAKNALPSIAYGFKTCSDKFKIAPQDKFYNNNPVSKAEFKAGRQIRKLIGYDAGERHRAKPFSDKKWLVEYPLIEWGWDRKKCIDAIKREGIPLPGKSSCFFCPHSKDHEIRDLNRKHPELMERALEIERGADTTVIAGLGRRFKWENVIATDDMFDNHIELPCGCYGG